MTNGGAGRSGRRGGARTVVVEPVDGFSGLSLPTRATPDSTGFDVRAAVSVELRYGKVTLVRTGFRMRAPKGTFLEVRPRSGLSTKGVVMVNAPGTIDRDYPGEVFVPLTFLFPGRYRIRAGDRIAQLRVVDDRPGSFRRGRVRPDGLRKGGFGSTGR